ncbi:YfhE family protein [Neobacillus sp. PS3-34]|nr:YfhE family protein [Neobacillus sp. PS3-34]WML49831.1 YfhE family protein [Neobacillus sp. PS3-34]
MLKGRIQVEKKKKEKPKFTLTSMQEVAYRRDFKMADRAGGFAERKSKH